MLLPSVSGGGKSGMRRPSRSRHRACRGPGRHPGHRAAWTKGLDWFLRRIPTSSRRESSGSTKDASASTTPGSRSTNGSSWGSSGAGGRPAPARESARAAPPPGGRYGRAVRSVRLCDSDGARAPPRRVGCGPGVGPVARRGLGAALPRPLDCHTLATKAYDEWESSRAGEFTPGSWLEHFATIRNGSTIAVSLCSTASYFPPIDGEAEGDPEGRHGHD